MNLDTYLLSKNLDLKTIVAAVDAAVGLSPTDRLLAVGSLAEGLGNSQSDVDLLVISARDPSELRSPEVALIIENCLLDIQVIPRRELQELTIRLSRWAAMSWDISRLAPVSTIERRLLHRVARGRPIVDGGNDCHVSHVLNDRELALLDLQIARHMARTLQIDMAGYAEAGDYASLVFTSQDLLGHAADALLAGHGLSSSAPKWRSRLLAQLPSSWQVTLGIQPAIAEAKQLYWSLHRAPAQPEQSSAMHHAHRILTFARAIFAWTERKLVRNNPKPVLTLRRSIDRKSDDRIMPLLRLDVEFLEQDAGAIVGRLNHSSQPINISQWEFPLVLLFDGRTTIREAELAVSSSCSPSSMQVEGLIARLQQAQLFER